MQAPSPLGNDLLNLSMLQGNKLFNNCSSFILNITSPDTISKKCNVDLICVIDISGSMNKEKLTLVKDSLKTIISLMDKNDRMALILFNDKSTQYLDLSYLSDETKKLYKAKIDGITARGGTNILSGLEKAVILLKEQQNNKISEENSNRISSVILLSDGNDNDLNDIELADGLKNLTKGSGLSFTLHTFGFGDDHDPKIMNRLANLRDGSFYYVEELKNVQDYFVNVLGGCMSVLCDKAELTISLLDEKSKIKKVFGADNLYQYELKDNSFKATILQVIAGKEYTFVMEVQLSDLLSINQELFKIELQYEDLNTKEIKSHNIICKYRIINNELSIADEEYIRSKVFDTINEAKKLKEKRDTEKALKILNEMKLWLNMNYKGQNGKFYIGKIEDALRLFKDDYLYECKGRSRITADISENMMKRGGCSFKYSNCVQKELVSKTSLQRHYFDEPNNPIPINIKVPASTPIRPGNNCSNKAGAPAITGKFGK